MGVRLSLMEEEHTGKQGGRLEWSMNNGLEFHVDLTMN